MTTRDKRIAKNFVNGTHDVFDSNLRFNQVAICTKGDTALALLFA